MCRHGRYSASPRPSCHCGHVRQPSAPHPPPRSASRSPAPVSRMRHAPRLDRSAGRPSAPRPRPPQRDGGVAQPRSRSRPPAARPSPAIERQGSLPSVPRKPASARPRLAIERPAPLALDHAPRASATCPRPAVERPASCLRPSPTGPTRLAIARPASRPSAMRQPASRASPDSPTRLAQARRRASKGCAVPPLALPAMGAPAARRRRASQSCAAPPLDRLPTSALA